MTPHDDVGFPQFLGPGRNGVIPGPEIRTDWQDHPPKQLWRVQVGAGWGGCAIFGGRVVTMEQNGDREEIVARDLATGRELWVHGYSARFDNAESGVGPRSVPTISRDYIYATGGTGILTCLELGSGRRVWQVDLMKDYGGAVPTYGYSASPLVAGGLVWVPTGGADHSLVALDARTGGLVRAGGSHAAGYSSPVSMELAGMPQILHFHADGIAGHEAATGRVLWDFPVHNVPHVANPVQAGAQQVVVSCGYGVGSFLLGVSRNPEGEWLVKPIWKCIRLKSKFANFFIRNNLIYGLDDGMLACVDIASGTLMWKDHRFGHGQLLWVADQLLVFTEMGELVALKVSMAGPQVQGRFRIFSSKAWNPPAIAGDYAVVRTDREAVCLEFKRVPNG